MPDTVPSALEFFFFNDPATTEIYTLSLHDALPISANGVAAALSPDPGDYRHHRGGEDNGDAHLKNLLVHHQVVLPITDGRLDLGPWQAVFYCEFDGRRSKRLVIKVIGD